MVGSHQRRQETGGIEGQEKNHKKRASEASEQVRNGSFMAHKGLWNLAGEKDPEGKRRRVTPLESNKAVHEDNFLSSWLRTDGRKKEERKVEVSHENKEERGERRRREGEKKENETGTVKR